MAFKKPTELEVQTYFQNRGLAPEVAIDQTENFFNHYESCGWVVGANKKMVSWPHAVNNWIKNIEKFSNNGRNTKNGSTPTDYSKLW